MLLKNKTAIITGAQQGIGKGIAKMFSEHGATVILCDLSEERLAKAAEEITATTGNPTRHHVANITRKDDITSVVEKVTQEFGGIDILVNNAGVLKHSLIVDMEEDTWDLVYNVNVKGTFLFTQAVAYGMIARKQGKIVNVSSCSGKKPDLKQSAYNSSKSAIIGFTRCAALEFGPYGINVNAICPGATDTEMVRESFLTSPEIEQEWIEKTALKRLGTPEDMAKVAVFLASGLSDHMTGEALIVSAGELMGQ